MTDDTHKSEGFRQKIGRGLRALQKFHTDGLVKPGSAGLTPEEKVLEERIKGLVPKEPNAEPGDTDSKRFIGPSKEPGSRTK